MRYLSVVSLFVSGDVGQVCTFRGGTVQRGGTEAGLSVLLTGTAAPGNLVHFRKNSQFVALQETNKHWHFGVKVKGCAFFVK